MVPSGIFLVMETKERFMNMNLELIIGMTSM